MRLRSILLLCCTLTLGAALPLQSFAQADAEPKAEKPAKPKRERKTPAEPSMLEHGSVASVDGSGLVVESMGSKLTRYERTDKTIVRGAKKAWDALAPGDNVKVRVHGSALHAVVVKPSAEQSAEVEAQRLKAQQEYIKQQKAAAAQKKANPAPPREKKQQQPAS